MMTLSTLLTELIAILQAASHGNAVRDPKYTARVIIADLCSIDRAAQLAHPDQHIAETHAARARNAATRHAAGEPLSRIRGTGRFYDLDFNLSPDTLDPRPETEIIVRTVLQLVLPLKGGGVAPEGDGGGDNSVTRNYSTSSFITPTLTLPPSGGGNSTGLFDGNLPTKNLSLLDLGTGTGCIPIAILKHAPHIHATAVDISDGALHTAHQNAVKHEVDNRLTLIRSNWYENLNHPPLPPPSRGGDFGFDIITSNPPYIPSGDIPSLDPNVRIYDPIRALDGGMTGLDPYEILIAGLDTHLSYNGIALFEIGVGQAPDIMRLGEKYGLDVHPPIVDDAHIPRVICVTRPLKK